MLRFGWLRFRSRWSIPTLLARAAERRVISVVAAVNGRLAILTIGLFAWLTDLPLVFPALGPTAFLLFSAPFSPAAAPRSVIVGHGAALAIGWTTWQLVCQWSGATGGLVGSGWLVGSATLALGVTALALVWLACPHPPACASALIVALGGIMHGTEVLLMGLAVLCVTVQATAINRAACLAVPLWSPRSRSDSA
jgi:CBS-domain-containing membrane protein